MRDVGDHRAQQPLRSRLAVCPAAQLRQVASERLELLARWLAHRLGLLGELGLRLGELAKLLLPARLQAAATSRFSGSQA